MKCPNCNGPMPIFEEMPCQHCGYWAEREPGPNPGSESGGAAGSAAIVAAINALNEHIEKGLNSFESAAAREDRKRLVTHLIECTKPPNGRAELPLTASVNSNGGTLKS